MSKKADRPPDYESYSLDELEDARRFLDVEAFPERAALIDAEIEKRRKDRPPPPPIEHQPVSRRIVRVIAVWEVIAGILTLRLFTVSILQGTPPPGAAGMLGFIAIHLFVAALAVLSAFAGIQLWRQRNLGLRLSILVQGLQSISFRIAGFTYFVVLGGAFIGAVQSDLWFSGELFIESKLAIHWAAAKAPWLLGINFVAAACLGVLFNPRIREVIPGRQTAGEGDSQEGR
jgi:hypothetical protein